MNFSLDNPDWASMSINLLGKELVGITSCKYSIEQENEEIYGAGNAPIGIGRGNKKIAGEIILLQSELEQLEELIPAGQSLLDVKGLSLVVSYLKADGQYTTDIVYGLRFNTLEKGMAQGDKNMEITLPFMALDVKFNV